MRSHHRFFVAFALALAASLAFGTLALAQTDPLPSWNDGATRDAIVSFVEKVTEEGGSDYVAPADRIATFDNDGTLWIEQPAYVQLVFALDRVKQLAPQHPEWKDKQPFKAALEGDMKTLAASGQKGILELIMATHAGMTPTDFKQISKDWLAKAKDPRFKRHYTQLVYQPMLELLSYLRANGFKTFIVSGGGIEFIRAFSEDIYGIPPDQVVGSSIKTKFEIRDGKPTLVRLPEMNFVDDKTGKPIGINQHIGQRPIAAFGNSDGDRQMLEYTKAGDGARLAMLVLHDDAKREYAYGPAEGLPDSKVGTFTQALYDEAKKDGWVVISMKNDWKQIFPPPSAD